MPVRLFVVPFALFAFAALAPCTSSACPQEGAAAPVTVDLSGVEHYLEVTAVLAQDQEPPRDQWDRLFATPGYAVLLAREFRRQDFEERFRLAFMPSRAAELSAALQKQNDYSARMLAHLARARNSREEIERRLAQFRTAEFAGEAMARARAFLPAPPPSGQPRVAFVVFAADSRGYDPVVIDILYLQGREEFLDVVAHEFHHWYRARLATDLTRDVDTLWVIQQVHLEGVADLINVPRWMAQPAGTWSPMNKQFAEFHAKSGEIIRAMDDLFRQMRDKPADRRDLGQQLRRAVPRSGHPTGFFMAQAIVAALGKDAVVRTVANPFAFFRAYNEAAASKPGGAPAFSPESMAFLLALEKRYQLE